MTTLRSMPCGRCGLANGSSPAAMRSVQSPNMVERPLGVESADVARHERLRLPREEPPRARLRPSSGTYQLLRNRPRAWRAERVARRRRRDRRHSPAPGILDVPCGVGSPCTAEPGPVPPTLPPTSPGRCSSGPWTPPARECPISWRFERRPPPCRSPTGTSTSWSRSRPCTASRTRQHRAVLRWCARRDPAARLATRTASSPCVARPARPLGRAHPVGLPVVARKPRVSGLTLQTSGAICYFRGVRD